MKDGLSSQVDGQEGPIEDDFVSPVGGKGSLDFLFTGRIENKTGKEPKYL